MAERPAQNYRNHRRLIPLYHLGVFGVFLANLVVRLVQWFRAPTWIAGLDVLVALGLLALFFYARIFALTVQDRVIRLEMRLRLVHLLPPDLAARIPELTPDQLVALRFASDGEMSDLVREVLTTRIR